MSERVKCISIDILSRLMACLPINPDLIDVRIPMPVEYPIMAIKIKGDYGKPDVIAPIFKYAEFRREKDPDGNFVWIFNGEVVV